MRVHQRPYAAMGKVPVAPRRKRLPSEGERKVIGLAERPRAEGFKERARKEVERDVDGDDRFDRIEA